MPAQTVAVRKLVTRQSVLRSSLTATLVQALIKLWRGFDGWEDKDKVEALAARSATLVDSAVRQERLQVRAYLDTYFKLNGDLVSASEPVPALEYDYPRDKVTAFEVYKRPAREYGYWKGTMLRNAEQLKQQLAEADKVLKEIEKTKPVGDINANFSELLKKSLEDFDKKREEADAKRNKVLDLITSQPFTEEEITQEAINRGIDRLEKLANTDIQLARRDESLTVMDSKSTVIGFRRVVHPELSTSGTCGMCITASTRFYTLEHLEPIHNFCKCETVPITTEYDPGKTMNDEDFSNLLDQMYTDAGGNGIDALSNTRYRVKKNSETGWELVESKSEGTAATSASLRRIRRQPIYNRSKTELKMLKSNNENLQRRYDNGETELAPMLAWSNARISEVSGYIKAASQANASDEFRIQQRAERDKKLEASKARLRKRGLIV